MNGAIISVSGGLFTVKNSRFDHLWFGNTLFDAVQGFAIVAFSTQSDPHRPRVQGLRCYLRERVKSFLWSRNRRTFREEWIL